MRARSYSAVLTLVLASSSACVSAGEDSPALASIEQADVRPNCVFSNQTSCAVAGASRSGSNCTRVVATHCGSLGVSCCPAGLPGEIVSAGFNSCIYTSGVRTTSRPSYEPMPTTSAATQLLWMLGRINDSAGIASATEVQAHVDSSVVGTVDLANQWAGGLRGLATQYRLLDITGIDISTENRIFATLRSDSGLGLRIVVETNPIGGKMTGLEWGPWAYGTCDTRSSASEINASLSSLGKVSLYGGEIAATACTRKYGYGDDAELAIASTFKLYVLASLEARIRAGTLTWNTLVLIRPEVRSWLDNTTLVIGSSYPVSTLARRMIINSDNTATDHLIDLVGRNAVRDMVASAGHSQPERNDPFIATREAILIKTDIVAIGADYGAMSAGAKLLVLTYADSFVTSSSPVLWTSPKYIEGVDWFASGRDLCGAARKLRDQGEAAPRDATMMDTILGAPIPVATDIHWSWGGGKGGSEPGVKSSTYIVERRSDGRWFFVATAWNDTVNASIPDATDTALNAAAAATKTLLAFTP